jgi:hypothetical protein
VSATSTPVRMALAVSAVIAVIAAPAATAHAGAGAGAGRRIAVGRIAYLRDYRSIKTMAPDGTDHRTVVSEADFPVQVYLSGPSWSPDGRRLAFSAMKVFVGPSGAPSPLRMYTVRADGTRRRTLGEGWNPAFSPNGSRIAFVRDGSVWAMARDGSDAEPLTSPHFATARPQWSPDGSRIAYYRGAPDQIWVVNADGTDDHLLVDESDAFAWSPDGTQMAYQRIESFFGGDECGYISRPRIVVANVDGSNEQPVTTIGGWPGGIGGGGLTWSPDGGSLAYGYGVPWDFNSCEELYAGHRIAVTSLEDSTTTALPGPKGPVEIVDPVWGPAGS